ncbi:acyltransferase family protein [Marinoscillum furvescens]|uniref:Putative acyltransferase n=1 Tax=Marinoscillum furvescens DSM 4134 TaxID=1122208 RepID=A0A3D9KWA0_MARFU|nr:heparan-alpha-glucosaminide N-acetyltransferase domain-containing protein [Marinoscillum furvescens]RED92293.1 putative acyltransferase [Marinoscillum furvescens DSM 4134]
MEKQYRYTALDVFRGATIALMILVNSPGKWGVQYGPLRHAAWHGFTLTDLVFPAFLFAVGNAMAFVLPKLADKSLSDFWVKVIKRTVLIFLIGYLLNFFPFYSFKEQAWRSIADIRFLGVLQRIALCYFLAMVLVRFCSTRVVLWVSGAVLLGYWLILYWFGGVDPYSLSGYAGNVLDKMLIGEPRLYGGEGVPFDPEGLLSTLPAMINVIFGYYTGVFLRAKGPTYEAVAKLLLAGAVIVLVGLWWDWFFPINKKIWTSSFVMLTSGISMMCIAALVYLIEVRQRKNWTYFFEVFGRNPLFIYALSWVLGTLFYLIPVGETSFKNAVYSFFESFLRADHAAFIYAVLFMLLHWLVGYVLDRKKIYIKV